MDLSFFTNRRVLLTGHTGFKGSWLSRILIYAGAQVTGYALNPPTNPNLFDLSDVANHMNSVIGDIRDYERLKATFEDVNPEIVLHLAAQPIVRDSYKAPRYTYETNVMGTVNVMECVRLTDGVGSVVNVTTDKVYYNQEWPWGYREIEQLDGFDPYSNSKSCSELVTHSFINSFFREKKIPVSTARAGNVIGGGDFANDRIIPDCIRAAKAARPIIVRNPFSTRPYQHVLEPIMAYLAIAQSQYHDYTLAGAYNVGPDDCDCVSTGNLVEIFCKAWGRNISWENHSENGPHEANFLKLDCSKIRNVLKWQSRWHIQDAIQKTCEWTDAWLNGGNIPQVMDSQICEYLQVK